MTKRAIFDAVKTDIRTKGEALQCLVISVAFIFVWLFSLNIMAEEMQFNFDLPPDTALFKEPAANLDTSPEFTIAEVSGESKETWQEQKVYPFNIVRLKPDGSMRIRGWKMNKTLYFGQTKVANEWGVGLLVERKGYHYAINNRGIAFLKRF